MSMTVFSSELGKLVATRRPKWIAHPAALLTRKLL